MAQAQSEIRYLTPLSVDVKKKKYYRLQGSRIPQEVPQRARKAPSPSHHRHFAQVSASRGSGRKARPSLGIASLCNRLDEIIFNVKGDNTL